ASGKPYPGAATISEASLFHLLMNVSCSPCHGRRRTPRTPPSRCRGSAGTHRSQAPARVCRAVQKAVDTCLEYLLPAGEKPVESVDCPEEADPRQAQA